MMVSGITRVELAMARDVGAMCNIDVQAQDYPHDLDVFNEYVTDATKAAYVAKIGIRTVAYLGCMRLVDAVSKCDDSLLVTRLSVHPEFRRLGVSRKLMSEVWKRGLAIGAHNLVIMVPSYKIDDPTDPDYIGWWLAAMNMKIVGCIDRMYFRYGKYWDAYKYEAVL